MENPLISAQTDFTEIASFGQIPAWVAVNHLDNAHTKNHNRISGSPLPPFKVCLAESQIEFTNCTNANSNEINNKAVY